MRPETLNHYRIVRTLGAGGMGEVYLAEDTKLHRNVAVKVLLDDAAPDPERRERFAREARAVAAIAHPNIVTIHSVEEDNGRLFLTMEYVEGKALGELIPRGGLPLDRLLALAIPLADAVSSAHGRGVIHRDLKPANVMVSDEGRVKVLDFGLARLREDSLGSGETMTAQITGEGRVLGTAAYMSPEQAEAKPVDGRSDVFSLGVMLFEMATGERPFKGDSAASLISSILRDTPQSITTLRPDVPRELARIIKRCLQKDPEQRYQTAKDLRNDLQMLRTEIDSGEISATDLAPVVAGVRGRRSPLLIGAAAVVLVALAGAAYFGFSRRAKPSDPFGRFTIRKITNQGNVSGAPAISPDGTYIAYTAHEDGGESMRVRQLSTGAESVIIAARTVNYVGLTFSPDGQYIYYVVGAERTLGLGALGRGELHRIPFLGGPSTRLIGDVNGMAGLSPDGKRVAFVRANPDRGEQSLIAASVDGSNETVIATVSADHGFAAAAPAWSPDGRTIAACVWKRWGTIVAYPAEGGTERVLAGTTEWGAFGEIAWAADGGGLLVAAAHQSTGWSFQMWHVSYPAGVVTRITSDANSYFAASVPRDGSSILTLQNDWLSSLSVAPASNPERALPLGIGRGDGCAGVAWTPDGRIVYGTRDWDLATIDADGRNQRTLTTDEHNNRHPSVSRDGRYVFFLSWRGQDSPGGQYRMTIDGGEVKRLTRMNGDYPQATPDGRWVLFSSRSGGKDAIWKASAEGGKEEVFSAQIGSSCAISPDGTVVAGWRTDTATRRTVIEVLSFATASRLKTFEISERLEVGMGMRGWNPIRWTPDGAGVVYIGRRGGVANLWTQPLGGGPARAVTDFKSDLIWDFDWSRDNRIVMARGRINQDVVMISKEK